MVCKDESGYNLARVITGSQTCLDCLLLCPGLPDVDVAIEILELNFLAAAVDGAAHIFVDLYPVLPAFSAIVFHGLLRSGGLHLDFEIAIDIAIVGAQADIGLQ